MRANPKHGRLVVRKGISRNLILGGLAGLVLTSFSVLGLFIYTNSSPDHTKQLEIALRLMRKGDGEASARIARSISPKALKKRGDLSKREFLLGTHERKAAEGIAQRRIATERNEKAVKHLEKSRDLTFPDGYEGQGNYYLGMALFDLFRWDDAEMPLEIAAERWPHGRADSIERLVDIDLSFDRKDTESAISRIDQWRALPRTSAHETDRADIKEMQTLYAMGEFANASNMLEQIPMDSILRPDAELIYGRCLQKLANTKGCTNRDELLKAAAESFQKVLNSAKTSVPIRRQSNLELGRVQRDLGNATQAVSTFSALRLSSPYEPESLASGLEEIDTLIELKKYPDAIDTLFHITKNFGELKWYQNEWMPLSEMRKKVVATGERLVDEKAYSEAAEFSEHLPKFCDDLDRLRLQSRLYELWAKQSFAERNADGETTQRFATAAEAYAALAQRSMRSPQYSDLLARASENFQRAGKFDKSNELLDRSLQFEPRENQPKGWLAKARNYKSMEKPELAIATLYRILESNTSTSLVYEARLEAARILAAKDDFQQAEELIVQNLYYGDLKPESPTWRESLFELGSLLFRRGEMLQSQAKKAIADSPSQSLDNFAIMEQSYNELVRSIARIEESLQRFENDPRRIDMLYTTAKAYQLAAWWPDWLLKENRIANEDTIAGWKAQRKELLRQSQNTYGKLRQEIVSSPEKFRTNSNVENYLRNSYFGESDLLYQAGEYEEALNAYREAANRFINSPESLEAMTQIANCQKQLGRNADCLRTLETAKETLQRMTVSDDKFKAVTSHDRAGWEQYLNWMISDLGMRSP